MRLRKISERTSADAQASPELRSGDESRQLFLLRRLPRCRGARAGVSAGDLEQLGQNW
jgi:hypothetical protein